MKVVTSLLEISLYLLGFVALLVLQVTWHMFVYKLPSLYILITINNTITFLNPIIFLSSHSL